MVHPSVRENFYSRLHLSTNEKDIFSFVEFQAAQSRFFIGREQFEQFKNNTGGTNRTPPIILRRNT